MKVGDLVRLTRERMALPRGSMAIILKIEEAYSRPRYKLRFFNTRRKTILASPRDLEVISEG